MSTEYGSVAGYGIIVDDDDPLIEKVKQYLIETGAYNPDEDEDGYFEIEEYFTSDYVVITKGGNFIGDYGYEYLFIVPGDDTVESIQAAIPKYLEEMKKFMPEITEEDLAIVHATWVG